MSPWAVMEGVIVEKLGKKQRRDEASAFLEQAHAFYESGSSSLSANPLLNYYAFLNLAKALILVLGHSGPLNEAYHGLGGTHAGPGANPAHSTITVKGTTAGPGPVSVFAELLRRLGFRSPPTGKTYAPTDLFPQVVVGHRLWRIAARRSERFVGIEKAEFIHRCRSACLRQTGSRSGVRPSGRPARSPYRAATVPARRPRFT